MTQTCERFEKECDMLNRNMQSPNNDGTCDSDMSKAKGNKRESGTANDDMEQSKKQKPMPLNISKFDQNTIS